MSKNLGVSLWVPLITIVFFLLYFIYFWQEERVAYEDFTLQKKVNYAADAAVDEMLFTGDLGTDYATTYKNVQPDLGVQEFEIVLLESLGMPTTEKNRDWLEQHYLKSVVICAYDGLYVYDEREYETGKYDFVYTPKIPYFYQHSDGTNYTLNFGLKEGYSDSWDGTNYRVNSIGDLPNDITYDQKMTAINNQVSWYLQESIARAYGGDVGDYAQKSVRLPAVGSEISSGQPIKNISFIGVVETDNSSKKTPNLCMGIGGARITETDQIIGLTIGGVKYYCPQSKAQLHGLATDSGTNIVMFTDEYDAAMHDYNCYLPAYE